ncbi:MAG: dihydrolipoyllysine-residue acetyltransferase [Solirubrobacteraceae bacterium]
MTATLIPVSVPDIGDFAGVPVIEILVSVGDQIAVDDSLVTLESDKASMDVPSPAAGTVAEIHVKIGDPVSQGSLLLTLAPPGGAAAPEAVDDRAAAAAAAGAPAAGVDAGSAAGPADAPAPAGTASSTLIPVSVPDIGDFAGVPVIEILVSVGQQVAVDDSLVTLESDKASMDVPSPAAGTVAEIHVKIGDPVSQGDLLLTLAAPGGAAAPEPDDGAPAPAAGPTSRQASTPEPPAPAPAPRPAQSANGDGHGGGAVYASPSVRRIARELGVSLAAITGSGRKGRITVQDVQNAGAAAAAAAAAPAAAASGGLSLAPWPSVDFEQYGPVERVPRTRIQRISAPVLARNWVMIPHVTHNDEADITELEVWRKQLNAEHARDELKFTMLTFLVAACVATLKQFPGFNAALDGEDLVLRRYYNIGFAADTPGGLVVPVIKEADRKGLAEIAQDMADLSNKARQGKLGPSEMSGGTFTISSLGGIGGTSFTPIINAPEVAILGVTRSATKPVWNGSAFEPRLLLPLSLSYDHRVIDGAAAARFVAYLVKVIGDLRRALL